MKKLLFLLFLLPGIGYGQTIFSIHFHNSFEIGDSIETIEFDLAGEMQIESWAGNTILIETKVKSEEASDRLLKFLKDKGRYDIISEKNNSTLVVRTKNNNQRGIITKSGDELLENITHTIFLPENFVKVEDNRYRKQ